MTKTITTKQRVLLNGDKVWVSEAKKSRAFTLTKKALSEAECSPDKCAIANQGKLDTGKYWEVYSTVAYEVYAPGKARRYEVPVSSQKVLMVNDLGSARLAALEGHAVKLLRPSPCRTRAYFRSAMRKLRDKVANAKSRKRKPAEKRPYSSPLAQRLDLRERAAR